ncbi:tripartite tricarboxylate transporter TctB family protein [Devosia sp. BSSL-BM10]|uniref:Tripartite tricarboxylate transporter TctB family protein n=1 Tax=Devosia litorisediminis TaxID=2829817 RepID=A0A942E604_9HYPH|nr:tripartite tricarboxylate transporter TctB family protein [Devosia litorisediminis]MBS3848823.1 tripartite tricarboxylate transporter TctB family protein [Devosia litorisediminis]
MQDTDRPTISLWRRLISGATVIVFGAAMLGISWSYPTGSVSQMGPGFMPHVIAIGLMIMGAAVLLADLRDTGLSKGAPPHWRALILISASVIVFGAVITRGGLVPAMFGAVLISTQANSRTSILGTLVYSVVVTLCGWLLFIVALGLPISAFGR